MPEHADLTSVHLAAVIDNSDPGPIGAYKFWLAPASGVMQWRNGTNTAFLPFSAGDHGTLTGLADDDHTQYHNNARGDVRYPLKSLVTTKGDLLVAPSSGVLAREGVGSNGQFLKANSAQANGVEWANIVDQLAVDLHKNGSVLDNTVIFYRTIWFPCTITGVRLLAKESGSVVVDIWKDTYANYPPTNADSITASATPTLSSAQKMEDTTLTGWTTSIAAGDTLAFAVEGTPATITLVTCILRLSRT